MTEADLARWEAQSNADSAPGMHEELLACIAEVRRLRAEGLDFVTKDDPEAHGRAAREGEQRYTLRFPLADAREVRIHMGTIGYRALEAMMQDMRRDDAIEAMLTD